MCIFFNSIVISKWQTRVEFRVWEMLCSMGTAGVQTGRAVNENISHRYGLNDRGFYGKITS